MGWDLREVSHVRKEIQHGANTETKGTSDLQRPNGVLDVIENVVHIRPSVVRMQYFEHRCRVLKSVQINHDGKLGSVWKFKPTSLLLFELPTKTSRKFACGSWTAVFPAKTAHPVKEMKRRITTLKTFRA